MSLPQLSLRTLLIAINLVVLILPVAGIQLMRLYESALVRQTESALIAQAAFVAAAYRARLNELANSSWRAHSIALGPDAPVGHHRRWAPRPAELDLATSAILPSFPEGIPGLQPDPLAAQIGQRLTPVLKDAQLVTLAAIRVVDPSGIIVASTATDIGESIAAGEELAQALKGSPASRLRVRTLESQEGLTAVSRNSAVRVFVTAPIINQDRLVGAVMLSRTPPSIVQALSAKRWLLLGAFAILVSMVLLMSWLTVRLIARPIKALATQADEITQGKLSAHQHRGQRHRTQEMAKLQTAINNMATTLEDRAAYLQTFAQHLSHEFKTPIASIRAAIEVLQDHDDMPSGQRHRFLSNIAADAERMQKLTSRLMALAEADLEPERQERFSLASVVAEVATEFRDQLKVHSELDETLEIVGNRHAMHGALTILLENASQHGASIITVESEGKTRLLLRDNGDGISAGNREKIFTPFFTTKRDSGGTGLGLSIARALLNAMQANVVLLDEPQTCFAVEWPEASAATAAQKI